MQRKKQIQRKRRQESNEKLLKTVLLWSRRPEKNVYESVFGRDFGSIRRGKRRKQSFEKAGASK